MADEAFTSFFQFSQLFDKQLTNQQARTQSAELQPFRLAEAELRNQKLQAEIELMPKKYSAASVALDQQTAKRALDFLNAEVTLKQKTFDYNASIQTRQQNLAYGTGLLYGWGDGPPAVAPAPDPADSGGGIPAQITRFGNRDDPTGDANSLKGKGNRENQMIAGSSVALKESTAARLGLLNEDGKPAGQVEVLLPDGTIQILDVDDTIPETSGSNDRLDFFDPDGNVIPIDGLEARLFPVGQAPRRASDQVGPSDGLLAPDEPASRSGAAASVQADAAAQIASGRPTPTPTQTQSPAPTRSPLPGLPQVSYDFAQQQAAIFDYSDQFRAEHPDTQQGAIRRFESLVRNNPNNLVFHNQKIAQPYMAGMDPEIQQQVLQDVRALPFPFGPGFDAATAQAKTMVEKAEKLYTEKAQQRRVEQGLFSPAEKAQIDEENLARPGLGQLVSDIVIRSRNYGAISSEQKEGLNTDARGLVLAGRPDAARQVIRNATFGKTGVERELLNADLKVAKSAKSMGETMEALHFDNEFRQEGVDALQQSRGLSKEDAEIVFDYFRDSGQIRAAVPATDEEKAKLAKAEEVIDSLPETAFDKEGRITPGYARVLQDAEKQRTEVLKGIKEKVLNEGLSWVLPLPGANKEMPLIFGGQQGAGERGQRSNELRLKAGRFNAAYIKSISGAASTDQEFKRLSSLTPTVTNSAAMNFNALGVIYEQLEFSELSRIKTLTAGDPAAIDFIKDPEFNFPAIPQMVISGEDRPRAIGILDALKEVGSPTVEKVIGESDAIKALSAFIENNGLSKTLAPLFVPGARALFNSSNPEKESIRKVAEEAIRKKTKRKP